MEAKGKGKVEAKKQPPAEEEEVESKPRKTLIVGNWKCHGDLAYVKEMVNNLLNKMTFDPAVLEVLTAPPLVHIPAAKAMLTSQIQFAAQNVSACAKGALTGEVTAESLKDFGIDWVIIGHSERRLLFQESEEVVAAKVLEAQKQGLNVILCIPDQLDERDAAKAWLAIAKQLGFLNGTDEVIVNLGVEKKIDWKKTVVAYEPIVVTAAKRSASIESVEETCEQIRKWAQETVAPEVGQELRIIYAGAVNEGNCKVYMMQKDVDGFLVFFI